MPWNLYEQYKREVAPRLRRPDMPERPTRYDPKFEKVVAKTLEFEGGYLSPEVAKSIGDPGGETNFGITRRSYPKENIKGLTVDRAKEIYYNNFWKNIKGEQLPPGLDVALFDFAVNSGPGTAIKQLQNLVGAVPDGNLGSKTLRKINKYVEDKGAHNLARNLNVTRRSFLKNKGNPQLREGWMNRINQLDEYLAEQGGSQVANLLK